MQDIPAAYKDRGFAFIHSPAITCHSFPKPGERRIRTGTPEKSTRPSTVMTKPVENMDQASIVNLLMAMAKQKGLVK